LDDEGVEPEQVDVALDLARIRAELAVVAHDELVAHATRLDELRLVAVHVLLHLALELRFLRQSDAAERENAGDDCELHPFHNLPLVGFTVR